MSLLCPCNYISTNLAHNKRSQIMCSLWPWYIRKTWCEWSCYNPLYSNCLSSTFSTGTFPFGSSFWSTANFVELFGWFHSITFKATALCVCVCVWDLKQFRNSRHKIWFWRGEALKISHFIKYILKSLTKKIVFSVVALWIGKSPLQIQGPKLDRHKCYTNSLGSLRNSSLLKALAAHLDTNSKTVSSGSCLQVLAGIKNTHQYHQAKWMNVFLDLVCTRATFSDIPKIISFSYLEFTL